VRVWRPRSKPSETDDLIAQAEQQVVRPQEEVRRISIRRVHMAAAAPAVVGLGLLILFPFLIAADTPVQIDRRPDGGHPPTTGPGPGTGHGPVDPHTIKDIPVEWTMVGGEVVYEP
jgi:hypothetical protein